MQRQQRIINNNRQITFHHSNPSQLQKSLRPQDPSKIDQLYQHQQSVQEQSLDSQISQDHTLTQQQIQTNIKILQKLWEYRYVKLVDYALNTNDWFRLFSFISQFKQKCIKIVRDLVLGGIQNTKQIDDIDHRYNLKGQGQDGIFLVQGIIVRLASVKPKNKKSIKQGFDYSSVKGLHQQFMSCNILNNLSISLVRDLPSAPRVRVPLSCLVKYLGFTALCQADSPCQGLETLVHGPTGTIYQYRQEYMDLLRVIGTSLNLKQFTMLSSDKKSVTIPFSLTLELHKIVKYLPSQRILQIINPQSVLYPKNGSIQLEKPQFYMMNVAKLWPLFIDSDIIKSVGYLRPQVVISSKSPLSNVVFCEVSQKADPQGQLQLADACKRVKQDHIHTLAKMLDNTTVFLVDSAGIQQLLHEYGINIRYMGALAEKVNLQFNKKILQTEMLARTCKKYFFRSFQPIWKQKRLIGKDLINFFKDCFIDFLNLLFVKGPRAQPMYKILYVELQKYYDYKISGYPPQMQGGGILHALCYHFGIKIKIIDYPFFQSLQNIFNVAHIQQVHGSAKSYDFDTSQIKQVCKRFKQKRKNGKLQQCLKQLKILSKMHSILCKQQTQPISPLPQAYFLTQMAQLYLKMQNSEIAKAYAEQAVKKIPQKHSDAIRPFQILLKYHSRKKQTNKSVQFYEKSLNFLGYHLGTNHPLTISVYNSFAYEQLQTNDPSKCQKMFLKSLQICQRSLGYTHATSSQILLQLAELPLPAERKISYYLQGLNVLQNIDGGQAHVDKIKKVCMKIAQMYEKTGNLDKMIAFAKRSKYWQLQLKGQSRKQLHRSVIIQTDRITSSVDQTAFVIYYAFRSYIKLLSGTVRDQLYKLFVSINDKLYDQNKAMYLLHKRLGEDRGSMMSVAQLLKNVISHLTIQLGSMIIKPQFYLRIMNSFDPDDKKLKSTIEAFIQIVSTVGKQYAQKVLTEQGRQQSNDEVDEP